MNGRGTSSAVAYDPSVVYILELATLLAIRDETTSAAVGREVAEALQNVVRDANNTHPLTLSRAIFYLLYLLKVGHVCFGPCPSPFLSLTLTGPILYSNSSSSTHHFKSRQRYS